MDTIPDRGWVNPLDSFDPEDAADDPEREARIDAERQLDNDIHRTFSRGAGRNVLQWLARLQDAPTFDPTRGFEHGAAYGFWREGQNDLYRQIVRRMQQARET